jgi:leucyl-tRNA synthetase
METRLFRTEKKNLEFSAKLKNVETKYNAVTPDAICTEYGADTLRLYEMF